MPIPLARLRGALALVGTLAAMLGLVLAKSATATTTGRTARRSPSPTASSRSR